MKKLYILFALILQTVLIYSQIEMRLVQPGGEPGIFRVQFRSTSASVLPTTSDQFTDMSFRIWWNDPSIIDIDVVTANTYAMMLTEFPPAAGNSGGATGTPGTIVAIAFCDCTQPNYPTNWVLNQWLTVATVNICSDANCVNGIPPSGIDASDFLIQSPYQFFPNLGITFTDYVPAIGTLPLNLISFKAEKSGEQNALLSWVTTNEENTSHFVVERSFDKKYWSKIGSVGAAGYSIGMEQYSFNDIKVYNGLDSRLAAYYRLEMVDLDGRTKLSPIESVVFGTGSNTGREFLVYPNPTTDGLQVEWDANRIDQPASLEFFDIQGKLVYSRKVSDNTNQEYIDFGQTTIQPGLYLLRILNGVEPLDYKQIVVERR